MHIEWNKVTWYSKAAAVVVFIGTFCIGFFLGTNYEKVVYPTVPLIMQSNQTSSSTTNTLGTSTNSDVSNTSHNASSPSASSGGSVPPQGYIHCGGFIQNAPTCPAGWHCQLNPKLPDTGGMCVPNME